MNLENVVAGAKHLVAEAIKIRSLSEKRKPARGVLVGNMPADLQRGRSGSIDISRSGEGREASPSASPLSRPAEESPWSNWPIAQSVGRLLDGARTRLFSTGRTVASEPEPMVLHREVPSAVPHPASHAGACGLCISYQRQGQRPLVEMAVACPGCGRGRGHDRDCIRVLADHNIGDGDWVDLPGQVRFDEWAESNERRGYLP